MRAGAIAGTLAILFLSSPCPSPAQDTPGTGGSPGGSAAAEPPPPGTAVAAVSGGWCPPSGPIVIAPPPGFYYWVPGPYGPVPAIPPTYVIAPGGGFFPPSPWTVAPPPILQPIGGPLPANDPVAEAAGARVLQNVAAAVRRQQMAKDARAAQLGPRNLDPERADLMVTVGDRLFLADNFNRAVERYLQAIEADPTDAGPRLRLAQVAVIRGDYAEAANQLREAEAADPGWLLRHPFDIQGLYPEPAQFAAMIEQIEGHLAANPTDRDAAMVLGAQLYLSGRTAQAADVLRRLTDRKPDPTLAALLEASRAVE